MTSDAPSVSADPSFRSALIDVDVPARGRRSSYVVDPVRLLIRNALLLTLEPDWPGVLDGWLAVALDGRIAGLGPGEAPRSVAAEEELDARGCFVAPGFVSAHSHLFTSGLRGIGSDQALYGWGRALAPVLERLDADDVYWLTLHGSLDLLANGVTTAYDFTDPRQPFAVGEDGIPDRSGHLRPQEHLEAQLVAKLDGGIRFVNSFHLDQAVGDTTEVVGRADEFVAFARRLGHRPALSGLALSGAVQWSDRPEVATVEVAVMARHKLLNQAHFLETVEHVELQRAKFDWYEQAGALGPDLIFGHFVQATPDIVRRAGAAGCGMCWQPAANGRLASGFADIRALRDAGLRVGMGLDDQACTDIADPFQHLRVGLYTQRAARQRADAMGVEEVLRLHTIDSAAVLHLESQVGSLGVGKWADLLVVDPSDPDTGPLWDPVATYVLACGLRNLKRVYVAGELVSIEGRSCHPGAAEVRRRVREQMARFR
jgi:cytosine/adenosine deaminase-related metal-dependent hydrolase